MDWEKKYKTLEQCFTEMVAEMLTSTFKALWETGIDETERETKKYKLATAIQALSLCLIVKETELDNEPDINKYHEEHIEELSTRAVQMATEIMNANAEEEEELS